MYNPHGPSYQGAATEAEPVPDYAPDTGDSGDSGGIWEGRPDIGGDRARAEDLLQRYQSNTLSWKKYKKNMKKAGYSPTYFDQLLAQDPEWAAKNPDRAAAAIARTQQETFEKEFQPFEDEALDFVNDDLAPEKAADQAGDDVRRSFNSLLAKGQAERRLARRGITSDASTKAAGERGRGLMRGASVVTAQNQARGATRDMQNASGVDLGNIGQGLSASAMQSLNNASGLATQRRIANDQASANRKMATITTGATGAMAGAMYGAQAGTSIGGPFGAVIGGALGLAAGYYGGGG